jgi:hypothetical protein
MQSSKAWDKFKAFAVADIGATTLLTRANDKSLFEIVPKEHHTDLMKWFVDREDNSEFEGRFKNIIEGIAAGTVADLSISALSRAFRAMKGTAHSMVDPSRPNDMLEMADTVLGRGNGDLVDDFLNNSTVVGGTTGRVTKRYRTAKTRTPAELAFSKGGAPKISVSEDDIRVASGIAGEAKTIFQRMVDDPNTSKEAKKAAKAWLKGANTRPYTRTNIENSGAATIKGGLETNVMLNLKSGRVKRPKRSREEVYADTVVALQSKTLGLKVNELIASGAYDEAGVRHHLAMSAAMGYDVEEIVTASNIFRGERASQLQSIAKTIVESGEGMKSKHFKEFVESWEALDFFDAGIQSTVGSAARIMNYQQVNPNDMIKGLDISASKARQSHLERKGKAKAVKEEETPLEYFSKALQDQDSKSINHTLDRIANSKELTSKELKKITQGRGVMDVFEAFYLGSLLSGVRTLVGSVGMGGAAGTAWKQLVLPTFEGINNTILRGIGGADTGARMSDTYYAAMSTIDSTFKSAKTWFGAGSDKTLADVVHTGFGEAREGTELALGTMKRKKILAELDLIAKRFEKEGAYTKMTLMNASKGLLASTMAIQNIGTRTIVNIDTFMKGLNNEATMMTEARRWWHREGGKEMFDVDTQAQFLEQFTLLQREYIALEKLPGRKRKAALDKLFEGRPPQVEEAVAQSLQKARRIGAEATLQQDASETLTGALLATMKTKMGSSPVGRFAATAIFPFTKTPINYVSEIIEHTPLAVTTRRFWDTFTNGTPQEELDAVSRISAGVSLMGAVAYGVSAGTISGTIRPEEREKAKALRIKPHSIFVDGVWYNYEKLGPIAALLSAVSDAQQLQNTDMDAPIAYLGAQALSIASENSHLSTFGELIEIIKDPNHLKAGAKFAFNKAHQTITPLYGAQASLRDIASLAGADVNYKYRSTVDKEVGGLYQELQAILTNSLKNNTAFLVGSNMVGAGLFEKDVDVTGNDVRVSSDTMSGKFLHLLGIGNLDNTKSPHVMELARLGLIPSNTNSNEIFGVKMTANTFKAAMKDMYHGEADAGAGLDAIVTSDAYRGATKGVRIEWMTRAMNAYKAYTLRTMFGATDSLQNEKYVKDLFKMFHDAKHTPINPEDEDYIKSLRTDKELSSGENPVNIDKFKKEYGF